MAPTPFVLFIHGGGFRGGDKAQNVHPEQLQLCLEAGISFAATNYRLTTTDPYPAQMHDAARALQFLRAHADEYNLDPTRVGATGGSSGAGISEWLAFRDDLADPDSDDPVARQSTRLTCIMVFNAQCTYDPREIKRIVPGWAHNHVALKHLFGVDPSFDWDKDPIPPEVEARIDDCGPLCHLKADAPPVMVVNYRKCDEAGNIHHGNFARHLKQEMDKLGLECLFRMDDEIPGGRVDAASVEFFRKHLGVG